jgi:hypothetical protein
MALANRHGAVLMTDSMQSRGREQLSDPGQKLLKFDSKTAFAIAGLGKATVPSVPELNVEILGVIKSLGDDKAETPMIKKLDLLAGLLSFRLSVLADVNALPLEAAGLYHLQVLMVGYDLDGVLKVGTLVISASPQNFRGRLHWEFHTSTASVESVPKGFHYWLGGMNDVAESFFKSPNKYAHYKAVLNFRSKGPDGASLTLPDLTALGRVLLKETAKAHREVGGPTQVATFHAGSIIGLEQPANLPEIKKPLGVSVVRGLSWAGAGGIRPSPGEVIVFESVAFPKGSPIELDGAIFLHCQITGAVVTFRGGLTYLDESTTITDSYLSFYPALSRNS